MQPAMEFCFRERREKNTEILKDMSTTYLSFWFTLDVDVDVTGRTLREIFCNWSYKVDLDVLCTGSL